MILTHDVILREMAAGRIVIEPFESGQVGPASIDLHLGDEIRVMEGGPPIIELADNTDFRDITMVRSLATPYTLRAGETIHGMTRERIRLAPELAGWLEGRSRYARLGLMIHMTSGFVAPGVDNHQVLEMSNLSGRPMRLSAGIRLCQIVVQRVEGSAVYTGRFADQQRL